MKKAKIFICHHPVALILYKNLAEIIRENDKDIKIILFKVNHEYFSKFDFAPHKSYYDKVIEFDFVSYKKNLFLGISEVIKFKKKLNKSVSEILGNFDEIDLFLTDSAWLPVNILLYNLSRQKNIKNINKISFFESKGPQTKIDRIKSAWCNLYRLFCRCYKVKVISTKSGKFVNFAYDEDTPGKFIKIISPTSRITEVPGWAKKDFFPYPVSLKNHPHEKKDMIFVFGDAGIFQFYKEYLPDYETFVKKISLLFSAIEKKYPDCKLYYKPHPSDGNNKVMEGVDLKKYILFDSTIDAPDLLDKFNHRIKAVYALSSFSVVFGSFFSVPSYFFYHYLFDGAGIEKFDSFYNQSNLDSRFICHVSNLSDIGKIDNLKRTNVFSDKNTSQEYLELLNI